VISGGRLNNGEEFARSPGGLLACGEPGVLVENQEAVVSDISTGP